MLCGLLATITEYKKASDITVLFEDGATLHHRTYKDFKNGQISHPGLNVRLNGDKRESFHGFQVISKAFTSNKSEDRVYYNTVCKTCGLIDVLTPRQMMEHAKNHLGETVRQDCGLDARVSAYKSCAKMTVVFEDGKEVTDVTWETFRTGQVQHPELAKRDPVYAGWRIEGEAFRLNGGRVWYNVSKNGKKDVMSLQAIQEEQHRKDIRTLKGKEKLR